MSAFIYPVSWLLGLILAPHTLVLLGNLAGDLQWLLPIGLAAGVGIYWLNATSLRHLTQSRGGPVFALEALSDALGTLAAATFFFGGRFITSIAASTVVLVTAGFVFNETIASWFPNFAFAFVLLGMVMTIHLFGQAAAQRFQTISIALTLIGIGVLTLMGIVGSPAMASHDVGGTETMALRSFLAVLMLFVGFDLAANHKDHSATKGLRPMVIGLLAAGTILALWSAVSIRYVPAHKLSHTFIAHTLAAKAIGGQLGRQIMAVVIISGTCAAVNALLWNQASSLSQLVIRIKWSSTAISWFRHPAAVSVLSGSIVAVMMATGMAGTDEIDTYVRAGLYFWMLYYAAVHCGVLLTRPEKGLVPARPGFRSAFPGFALMTGGSIALIVTDPEWLLVLKTAFGILLFMAAWGWITKAKRRGLKPKLSDVLK